MVEEQKRDPTWKPAELEPNVPVNVVLKTAKPIATGESKYGLWNLWGVTVEDSFVFERDSGKKITNYTGDAVCFPSKTLHEQFLQHTNGTKENVKVEVTLVPKKGTKGFYTSFVTKLVEEGETPPSNLQEHHYKFIKDFKTYVSNGVVEGTKDDFIGFATGDTYGIKDKDVIEKLWRVYNEKQA